MAGLEFLELFCAFLGTILGFLCTRKTQEDLSLMALVKEECTIILT